jgi:PAS domain S-box-containing protein
MRKKKDTNIFVDEVKRIMEDNLPIARFNEILRNIDRLKDNYLQLKKENEALIQSNEGLKEILKSFSGEINRLNDQVTFLEEILNSLQLIVSIKDVKRRNLLWYNQNYQRLLGYHHKQLQALNTSEAIRLYHPEDYQKIRERNRYILDSNQDYYSCNLRLRHINGRWMKVHSDYIVLKRASDGSLLQAMEIFSDIKEENS